MRHFLLKVGDKIDSLDEMYNVADGRWHKTTFTGIYNDEMPMHRRKMEIVLDVLKLARKMHDESCRDIGLFMSERGMNESFGQYCHWYVKEALKLI